MLSAKFFTQHNIMIKKIMLKGNVPIFVKCYKINQDLKKNTHGSCLAGNHS